METWASVEVVSMRRARQQRNIFGSSSMEFLNKFFFLIEFNRVLHKFFSLIKFNRVFHKFFTLIKFNRV